MASTVREQIRLVCARPWGGSHWIVGRVKPLVWTFCVFIFHGDKTDELRTAFRILVLIFLYTFAENLEILSYLYWPGLVVIGIALKQTTRFKKAQAAFPSLAQTSL
jgi:hypothetical protein